MASTDVVFSIFARDKASSTFDKISSKSDGMGRKIGSAMATGAKALAGVGLAAGVAAVAFGKAAVDEAREAEKVGKTTVAVIKATGGAAKVSAADVGNLAGKLSAKAGVDDEVIQSGANLLLTFKNVRNELGQGNKIFDRATAAAVDLSAAGFGAVSDTSKQLGKALNDPLKGISALGRAGVTFTEGQKKKIASLVEEGDTLKAQKIILKEVEAQVGGVAAAQATAGDKAKVAWGNFQEAVGTALLPVIDKLLNAFTDLLPMVLDLGKAIGNRLKPVFKAVSETVKRFFESFSGKGGSSLKEFIGRLVDLGQRAAPIVMQAFQTVGSIIKRLATNVFPIVSEIVGAVVGAFKKAAPDIKSAMTSIKQIVVGVLDILKAAWQKFGPFIIPVVKTVFGTIFKVVGGVLKAVSGVIKTILAVIKGDWKGAWNGIKQVASGIWQAIKALVSGALKVIKTVLSAAWSFIKSAAKRAWDAFKTVISKAWDDTKRKVSDRVDDIKRALARAWQAIRDAVSSAWRKVKETISGVWDSIRRTVGDRIDSIKRGLARAWVAIRDAVGNAWRNIKQKIFDAFIGIGRKIGEFRDAAPRKLFDAGKKLLSGLKNGMFEALGRAKDWFRDIGNKIIGGVKDFFGISSPSRVFAGFGGSMIDGLIKGMLSRNPISMAKKVFGGMTSALKHLVKRGLVKVGDLSGKAIDALGDFLGGAPSGVSGSAQKYAASLLPSFGWGQGHWAALRQLWQNESGWNPLAHNPSSGAHGIPQSLPASKMSSEGADYYTNPRTQIRWGLKYIKDRYGSPMNAWSFWNSQNPHWYGHGGWINEPIMGHGMRTGKTYGFGERGRELVVPEGQISANGGGGLSVTLNVYAPVGSQRELERWLAQAIRKVNRTVGNV